MGLPLLRFEVEIQMYQQLASQYYLTRRQGTQDVVPIVSVRHRSMIFFLAQDIKEWP